jgi:hypothetical protein
VRSLAFLLLGGCLEETKGEFIPLDPAYTLGHDDGMGDHRSDATGDGVWTNLKEHRLHITGIVKSDDSSPVQIDVNVDDASATATNGQSRVGALHLNEPGPFEFYAPEDVAVIHLQAFQDPEVDGPGESDPFARTDIVPAGKEPAPIILQLRVGARGQPEGLPGAPPPGGDPNAPAGGPGGGQGPQPGGDGQPSGPNPFTGVTDFVTVSGTISAPLKPVVVDFFKVDPAGQGGRTHLFKTETSTGAWSAQFPRGYGQILIEAFVDPQKDGPTSGDPMVVCPCNPLTVAGANVENIALVIPG